jgi:hypothetical protein
VYQSHTIVVSIRRPWRQVYEFLAEPLNLPTWATGIGSTIVHVRDNDWRTDTEGGPVIIRFSPRNELGVLDFGVTREGVEPVIMPVRVAANGDDGTELVYTVLQRPGSADEAFRSEVAWIEADLLALKSLLEAR